MDRGARYLLHDRAASGPRAEDLGPRSLALGIRMLHLTIVDMYGLPDTFCNFPNLLF